MNQLRTIPPSPADLLRRAPPPPPRRQSSQSNSDAPSGRRLPPALNKSGPPPIPWHTRPTKPTVPETPAPVVIEEPPLGDDNCLLCLDFSVSFQHAALFPRVTVQATESGMRELAYNLTAPFTTATFKAHAIFSWMHYNIVYDTVAFLSGNLKSATPFSTLSTGLAVCEGYAGLYARLAQYAGLECVVINGHGKGYGVNIDTDARIVPKYEMNHAWNAVKLDDGRWKLIDSCWGAGALTGSPPQYTANYNPSWFTMSNQRFGYRHYPTNAKDWYLDQETDSDGYACSPQTWQEYITTNQYGRHEAALMIDGRAQKSHGLSEQEFLPSGRDIDVSQGGSIRFQMQKECMHARSQDAPPPVFILGIQNQTDYEAMETNGYYWWLDIDVRRLGRSGSALTLYAVATINGAVAEGLTVEEYRKKKGRVAMTFDGVAVWQLQ